MIASVLPFSLFFALAACTSPTNESTAPEPSQAPGTTETTETTGPSSATTVPDEQVRVALGVLDPCALLTEGSTAGTHPYAGGPHSCAAQFDDTRIAIEVGTPFPDEVRNQDQLTSAGPLALYDDRSACRAVLPIGPRHGISLFTEGSCAPLNDIATSVARLLVETPAAVRHANNQDTHTACGMLSDAAQDPSTLVEPTGNRRQGIDDCEIAIGGPLARTSLSLDYARGSLEELARLIRGRTASLGGHPIVVQQSNRDCFLHTRLWTTDAPGWDQAHTEATIHALTCRAARQAARVVLAAADTEPPTAGDLTDFLIPATP